MAGDLERGVGALKKFQSRIDTLLTELEGGAGGSSQVALERVTRRSLGVGLPFDEADGFYTQYNRVHSALVQLSKSLGDQIELLRIAVHAADVGYDNVEEEERYRFHQIQARLKKEWDAAAEREKASQGKTTQPERQDATSGTTDLG
ncbi:hypothetical protein ABZ508_30955 [Streptomyces lavendulocolor]|uniref:Uncharacterized protein n=1 Tax=Streptomyces lavendulocolor TaxID=67316 RepID=A0ABV2WEK3_9ACTN